jgi:transposase
MNIPLSKARIVTDIINGKKYFYAVWSYRQKINKNHTGKTKGSGKSKIITHKKYLGTEKAILEKITSKKTPQSVYSKEYGLPMSILSIAKEIGLIEIIDEVLPYKVKGVKASEFILISAISKLNGSISKEKTGKYFATTVLPEVMGIKANKLDSKSYWAIFEKIISEKDLKTKKKEIGKKNNDKLTIEELEELIDDKKLEIIEEKIWSNLLSKYNILLDLLLCDGTNYFTYYQDHTRNSFGQKGKNKKGRHQLRQIALLMAVNGDGFPFISQLACGNIHDASLFPTVMGKLIKRYQELIAEAKQIRLTFDKGNNSLKNIQGISETEYIGSIPPSNHSDLTSIALAEYTKSYKEHQVYEGIKEIFGSTHKVFITFNEKLKLRQRKSFLRHTERAIIALQDKFNKHRPMDVGKLKAELESILDDNEILSNSASNYLNCKIKNGELIIKERNAPSGPKKSYLKEKKNVIKNLQERFTEHKKQKAKELEVSLNNILNTSKILHSKACRYLNYDITDGELTINKDEVEIEKKEKAFGKNIIFTNKLDADAIETISGYKDKYKVEGAFETIKDHRVISLHPIWHWTDSKIRIDGFISVLAYLLIKLLQYLATKENLKMSVPALLTALKGIREVVMIYPDNSVERKLEDIPTLQKKLLRKFGAIS